MTAVQVLLLGVAGILLLGAVGEVMFRRTGIPDVIWLVVAGAVIGPIGGIVSRDELTTIAPYFAAFTLVVIMFQGGVSLNLRDLAHSAARSTTLAVLGFVFTVALVGGASAIAVRTGVAPVGWGYLHGILLGAILGGSSSIIVIPAMFQARVRPMLRDLLSVESTLTDILCVVFTAAMIDVLLGGTPNGGETAVRLASSFGIAIGIGIAAGVLGVVALRLFDDPEHTYPATLAALLGLYVLIDRAGGSPALGIFIAAVVIGNASDLEQRLGIRDPKELDAGVRGFHQQMTFLIKTFFFVFLGAMLGPPWVWAGIGAAIGVLLVIARAPAVLLGLLGSELDRDERTLAIAAVPRGLAAGVLAVVPMAAGVPATSELPVVVYSAVVTSILLFAVGFRVLRPRSTPATTVAPAVEVPPAPATELPPATEAAATDARPEGSVGYHPADGPEGVRVGGGARAG